MTQNIPVTESITQLGTKVMTQSSIKSRTKSNEVLPSNVPHNEAILIPNHYSTRATSSHEYSSVKTTQFEENMLSVHQKIDSKTTNESTTALSINQNASRINKNNQKNNITLKPPPPSFRSELQNLRIENNQKIETDRESQIAWSEEDSVHTDWSESNVWSDEDDEYIVKGT